jgi:hypothetical protein
MLRSGQGCFYEKMDSEKALRSLHHVRSARVMPFVALEGKARFHDGLSSTGEERRETNLDGFGFFS